jgi:hypothetical protein
MAFDARFRRDRARLPRRRRSLFGDSDGARASTTRRENARAR